MWWLMFLLEFSLIAAAVILIILVLLQKGKGGGLAGALGGAGGQSAFGTKAGDLFTKITMVVAGVWIVLCVIAAVAAPHLAGGNQLNIPNAPAGQQAPGPEAPFLANNPLEVRRSRIPAASRQRQVHRRSPAAFPNRRASRASIRANNGSRGNTCS